MNKTTPTPPKQSVRAVARDLNSRVKELEDSFPQFVFSTDRAVSTMQNQLSHNTEIQNALVALIGEDQVIAKIEELRITAEIKKAENRREQVTAALQNGKIEPEEVVRGVVVNPAIADPNNPARIVDPGSYVAFVEFDPEGREVPYSYACVPLAKLRNLDHQNALTGQKAGFELEIEFTIDDKPVGKGKMVLLGVYKKNPNWKPPEAPKPEAPAPAVAAAPALPDVNTEAGEDKSLLDPSVSAPAPDNSAPTAQA